MNLVLLSLCTGDSNNHTSTLSPKPHLANWFKFLNFSPRSLQFGFLSLIFLYLLNCGNYPGFFEKERNSDLVKVTRFHEPMQSKSKLPILPTY